MRQLLGNPLEVRLFIANEVAAQTKHPSIRTLLACTFGCVDGLFDYHKGKVELWSVSFMYECGYTSN
ncbi:hypothetical protein M513_13672 [Trichuris suis]|uniref:Uncharacterized protein n=1 Tax=Trichuris suis TaxID=68888 RepID=A0A085LKF4_9BILA|nr:hypothetical protein M513_13672 [Trichuris suis]